MLPFRSYWWFLIIAECYVVSQDGYWANFFSWRSWFLHVSPFQSYYINPNGSGNLYNIIVSMIFYLSTLTRDSAYVVLLFSLYRNIPNSFILSSRDGSFALSCITSIDKFLKAPVYILLTSLFILSKSSCAVQLALVNQFWSADYTIQLYLSVFWSLPHPSSTRNVLMVYRALFFFGPNSYMFNRLTRDISRNWMLCTT